MIIREIKNINYKYKNNKKIPIYNHIFKKNNKIINPESLNINIKKIPPAYPYAEIYNNSSILAKCRDKENRLQYIYTEEYKKNQNEKKFCSLLKPLDNLEKLLKFISETSNKKTLDKEKAIATLLLLMTECHFRIGNDFFEKRYGSYGLTTLHKSHLNRDNRGINIEFVGKKGVLNKCNINKNTALYKNLLVFNKNSKEYLFEYDNKRLHSSDVNSFLKNEIKIRSKDLRTYFANLLFINEIKNIFPNNKKELNKTIDNVANKLHHTRSICKSSYLYPNLIKDIENKGEEFNKINNKSSIEIFKHYLKKNC